MHHEHFVFSRSVILQPHIIDLNQNVANEELLGLFGVIFTCKESGIFQTQVTHICPSTLGWVVHLISPSWSVETCFGGIILDNVQHHIYILWGSFKDYVFVRNLDLIRSHPFYGLLNLTLQEIWEKKVTKATFKKNNINILNNEQVSFIDCLE